MNQIKLLLGEILASIDGMEVDSGSVIFTCASGKKFQMFHDQGCCENVSINDVIGDPNDLIGAPILLAEETSSDEDPADVNIPGSRDSFTWTFYRIGTIKGDITLRWYGESNGCYSEKVEFEEITKEK